jgi:hypothetical protein
LTSWLRDEVERLADTPQLRALAIFDALNELFQQPDFDCCSFVNPPVDGAGNCNGSRQLGQLDVTAGMLETYAEQAGAANPQEAGHQLQILMMGAVVSAGRGDDEAARRARSLAELLLDCSR